LYSSHTLQYECQHHQVNLGGSLNDSSTVAYSNGMIRVPSACLDPRFKLSPAQADAQAIGRLWAAIVSAYTVRQVSYYQDKLTALAGVAQAFASLPVGSYHAGVWGGEVMARLLLWQSRDCLPRPREYMAPTWSWASCEGRISYENETDQRWFNVEVVEARTILHNKSLPYDRVADGSLTLRAHVRRGRFEAPCFVKWDVPDPQPKPGPSSSSSSSSSSIEALMRASTNFDTERRGPAGPIPLTCVATTWRVLEEQPPPMSTFGSKLPPPAPKKLAAVDGLILQPDGKGRYVRLGVFRGAKESEFIQCPREVVTII